MRKRCVRLREAKQPESQKALEPEDDEQDDHGSSAHEILSLKLPNIKFDFDVSYCMMQVVTDTSKISMRPDNSMQMSNAT